MILNRSFLLLDDVVHLLHELFADRILLETYLHQHKLRLSCLATAKDLLDLDVFFVVDDSRFRVCFEELAAEGDAFVGHPNVEELVLGILELLDGDRHTVH